jgi:hypothetical protein
MRSVTTLTMGREMLTAYYKVLDRVGNLTDEEFQNALHYTIRKHRLGDQSGVIDFAGSDLDYLADLISEKIEQDRLYEETLNIVKADASAQKQDKEEIA